MLGALAAVLAVPTAAGAVALTPGDVVVERDGNGVEGLSSSAASVWLNEFEPRGGLAATLALPTSASGLNKALVDGGSTVSDGELTLSGNGACLLTVGYAAALGTEKIAESAAKTAPRTVAVVNGNGEIDTTTALTNFANENNARSATSDKCKTIWVGGNGTKTTGGVVAAALGASTGTQLSETSTNVRQVEVVGSQLYTSADPVKAAGLTIATAGSGLPTTKGQTFSNLPFEKSPEEPFAYSLLTLGLGTAPDTIYVADNKRGAVIKYALTGGKWVEHGLVEIPEVTGVTANDVSGAVTIYATSSAGTSNGPSGKAGTLYRISDSSGVNGTLSGIPVEIAQAPVNEAFRGVAFAPGTVIGSGGPPPPTPSIAAAENSLPAALGDPTNRSLPITVGVEGYATSELTVTVTSSKESVAPVSGITVSGTGGARTLNVTPAGVGISKLTLTVEAPDGVFTSTVVSYGVSEYEGDASDRYYSGAADAGSSIDVGGGYVLVAGDGSNVLELYRGRTSGPPVKSFDFNSKLPFGTTEVNIHSSARAGNTLYWVGGMANTNGGEVKPARDTVFAATITGSGASTELTYLGSYTHLREDLVEWDEANGNPLGLAASAASGQAGERANGFKIQGLEFLPGSSTEAYVSFRAPLETTATRNLALVIPITDFSSLVNGTPGTKATFGTPLEWNLAGLSIRQIRKNAQGEYLVIAGTPDSSDTLYQLWGWDGETEDEPVLLNASIPLIAEGVWDAITSTPEPIANGGAAELLQDDSKVVWYGPGTKNAEKGLIVGLQKELGRLITVQIPLPGTPAAPHLSQGATPNQGQFTLRWKPAGTLRARFTLQHQDAKGGWSTVASGLSTREYAFTAGKPEAEGTWSYRVKESNETGDSEYSAESGQVKVDRTAPNTPTASADRSPDYAGKGGWYADSVTVTFTANGDPVLADGSPPSGVEAASLTAPQTFATSGSHTASGTVADKAANVSAPATLVVQVDATAPSLEIQCPATALVGEAGVTATVTASDGESGLASDPSAVVPIDTAQTGSQTVTRTAVDNVGHKTTKSCTTQVVYRTPGAPALTAGASPNGDGLFTLGWSGDDPLQYVSLSYTLQHHNAAVATWSTVAGNIGALSYQFAGAGEEEGTWAYRVQGSDTSHGQTTGYSPASSPVVVDETPPFPPSTSVSRAPDYAGNGGWYKDTVEVSFSKFVDANLSDGSPGSGIDPSSIPASQTIDTSGSHAACATVADKVGNVSAPGCRTVQVEATPPTLQVTCPAAVLEGSKASATVTASDPYSGLQTDPSGTVSIDTSHTGEQTITRTAVSNLSFETTKSCTTDVESSTPGAPALTAGASPNKNGRFTLGWSGPDPLQYFGLSYKLQHHDAAGATWSTVASNIGALSYEFSGGGEDEGTWLYRVQGSDPSTSLTSEYSPASTAVVVDRTAPNAPTVKASRAADYAGGGGWYKDSVPVTFSANGDPALADGSPGSGVDPASLPAAQTFETSGAHTASGSVADRAGNVSAPGTLTVHVDATAPSVEIQCPANAAVGQAGVSATVSASDAESGLATDPTAVVPISTAQAGTVTVTRSATDNVGHQTTRSCTTHVLESPPELGRCMKVAGELVGKKTVYHGAFANRGCTAQAQGGKYEWTSGIVHPGFTTQSSRAVNFETGQGTVLACAGEQGSGTFSTAKTAAATVLRFTNCKLNAQICTTSGRFQGELEAKQLEGELGWISKAANRAGLSLRAAGNGIFMEFACGTAHFTITGGIVVPLKTGKALAAQTLKYKGKHGTQTPDRLEGEPPEVLAITPDGGSAEPISVGATITQSFEEAAEVNTQF
ncbi:MAG TPA: hypothetical protein VGD00_09205 [Solirubrobacteraceae bacterium]